jgi:predicted enzyme related to lactoylglutathione lyase
LHIEDTAREPQDWRDPMADGEPGAQDVPHFAHGQLTYLQIPAADPMRSAAFYEAVFGWRIERPYASFEAPGILGQWVDDREPAPDAGPMLWITVDDVERALAAVGARGGETLAPPAPDGPSRILATIRDPGGNAIGLVQLVGER